MCSKRVQDEFKFIFKFFAFVGCHNFNVEVLNHAKNLEKAEKASKFRIFVSVLRLIIAISSVAYFVFISRDRKAFTSALFLAILVATDTSFFLFVFLTMWKFFFGATKLVKFYSQVNNVMEILSNEFTIASRLSKVRRRTTLRIFMLLTIQTVTVTAIAVVRKRFNIFLDIAPIMYLFICVIFSIFQYDLSNVLLSSLLECLKKFHQNSKNISTYESWLLNISDKALCQIKRRKLKVLQNVYVTISDNLSIVSDINGPTILIFTVVSIMAQIQSGYRVFMLLIEKKGLDFAFRK